MRNMKGISWALCLALIFGRTILAGGLVNNVGTSSEDRRSWIVENWDSTGTHRVSADSFFVLCFGPDGDSVYTTALDTSAAAIRSFYLNSDTVYSYSDLIANLDGTGLPGVYVLELRARQSATGLSFTNAFEFQLMSLDLSAGLIDTILNKDSMIVAAIAANAITDNSIEPNAIDLDEFGGSLASFQLENDLLKASHFDGSIAREIADTLRRDSLIYQGSGSSSAAIADAVWDELAGGHTLVGTFGSYLDARISQIAPGAGSGAYPCTAWVALGDSGTYLPGISVHVQNASGAAVASGRTESDGYYVAYLDDGLWQVAAAAPGWQIEPGSFSVTGTAVSDTLIAVPFDPGSPSSPALCRVYGYVFDVAGDSIAGAEVTARLIDGPARLNGYLVRPHTTAVTTDNAGYFQIDLIPNATLSPAGTRYEFSATLSDGVVIRSVVTVPDQASWQIIW